jgi:hypothetical protein
MHLRAWLLALVTAGTIDIGLLTGGDIERLLVATPAWNRTGLAAWADSTRSADLGSGRLIYQALALGGTLLRVAAVIVAMLRAPQARPTAVVLATALIRSCSRRANQPRPPQRHRSSGHEQACFGGGLPAQLRPC